MKLPSSGILASVVFFGGFLFAQDASPTPSSPAAPQDQQTPAPTPPVQPNAAQAGSASRIAPGSVIPVQLTKSIDAKKAKTGDEVDAKVAQDLKANNGEVIVAKDTKVVGHVTEAQARNKEQKESQIGITFDRAVMKNGGDVALPMSIQAIISPEALGGGSNNNGNSNAGEATGSSPAAASPSGTSGANGRSAGAGSAQPSASAPSSGDHSAGTQANSHEPITGNTQGVVGFPNLKLAAGATLGSIVSSEKNNVKLDSGTFMLLRVNQ